MKAPRILLVCAVEQELAAIAAPQLASLICGVGPVQAGIVLAAHLASNAYDLIINSGIAGGFAPAAPIGSGVVVTAEHYVELGREDGVPLQLPPPAQLQSRCALPVFAQLGSIQALRGPALTSATVTTSETRASELRQRYPGVLCESMEGFALASAAAMAQTPFIELRGISNRVGDRANSGWDLAAGLASTAQLTRAVLQALATGG